MPMSGEIFAVFIITIVGFLIVIWTLIRKLSEVNSAPQDGTMVEWIKALNENVRTSSQHLSTSLMTQTRDIHERLTRAAEVIGELKREAGQFSEISRSMKELHEFLKSPKLRGNIGEQVLNDLISQMIPKNSFYFQYAFKSGNKVDAAIKTDAGILPIDSKFPMENFQRMMTQEQQADRERAAKDFANDVRKHIRDISEKYVVPDEGTTDFAMMYVPSESVFYEIAVNQDVMKYARQRRVYPVSPNTMYATLSIILRTFQGKNFSDKSREILSFLRGIEKEYSLLEESLRTLGSHLENAHNKFGDVSQKSKSLGGRINATVSLQEGAEHYLPPTGVPRT